MLRGLGAARSARRRAARSATSTPSATNVITFGIGPAGTGKSWLAVAMAVQALQAKEVERIILTRPAVEAGERLGFLPGDLMAKVDPYLRPLYDALYDMVEPEGAQRLLERETVEVAPLAFMRGRTLNRSFIILDEAQNTTPEQMKMFLTRIGFGSKVVVTGDITQVDVPGGRSGLLGLEQVLTGIDGLAFVHLTGARRRAPPHRGGHRRRLRAVGRRRSDAPTSTVRSAPAGRRRRGSPRCSSPTSRPTSPSTSRAGARSPRRCSSPKGVRGDAELSLLFVDETSIAELNERFMGSEGPTDVLAFPIDADAVLGGCPTRSRSGPDRADPDPDELPLLLGDVVICPAVAARNAPDHAGTLDDELALLVVHGVLHVLGRDHADADEAAGDAGPRARAARGAPLGRPGARRLPAGAVVMLAAEFSTADLAMLIVVVGADLDRAASSPSPRPRSPA